MTRYLPTQNWPIRLLSLLSLSLASLSWAHDSEHGTIPAEPGWQLGAALGVAYSDAQYPAQPVSGVLGTGDVPHDGQGWRLEHGAVNAGVRINDWLGAEVGVGWHDQDEMHWESAWLQIEPHWQGQDLTLGLGRNSVPIGAVWQQAGHLDRFMLMPLVKQAFLGGDWIANGGQLSWRGDTGSWHSGITLSAWRQTEYPLGQESGTFPVLQLETRNADWQISVFASRLSSTQRQSSAQQTSAGHSHDSSSCAPVKRNVVCYAGDTDLLGASLAWQSPWPALSIRAAGAWRQERGTLRSSTSEAAYDSRSWGGWLEPRWQFTPQWEIAARYEWLQGNNELRGYAAQLLAQQARLSPNEGGERYSLMLGWRPHRSTLIALEAGQEQHHGQDNRYLALRASWQLADLWHGSW
ncbi:hypothetical protein [Chitinibacter sp. ZOR0017]|uniref:hypothetical protein n=1 Tax=Chitinibacter sp. ZOR0017 TaxID=1339254 RepID=UPI00068B8DA9|nr:hypothetical protein [Chitinibacter sp. ZOR0017]